MNKQVVQKNNQLLYGLIAALLIMSVSLVDAALIAVVASLITVVQLIVVAFTVALIDGGVFVTAWQMRRLG
jgi:TctA family transporter